MLFSVTGKQVIGSRQGFIVIIGLNELRISLTDTTHEESPFPRYPTSIYVS